MKKNLIYIGFIALLMVASCDEPIELYPLDVPSAETFYTNEVEIQGGVNACYSYVDAQRVSYLHPGYSWDGLSDVIYCRGNAFTIGILGSSLDYTHGYFRTIWLRMYQGIGRCNLMLQKIEENKDLISADKVKQFQGEVYFMRAYYYLRLTNLYGDVVYLDAPVSTVAEASEVTRTPRAEVLAKMYTDFDMAAQLLAGSNEKSLGRATQGAALAYKARAALHNNDWATAAAAAKAVMDLNRYSLMPSYETLFNEDIINNTSNTEQIFTQGHLVDAGTQTNFVRFTASRALGGWSTIVPTQNMIDSYLCTDGKNIAESPLYDKTSPYENRDPRMRYSLVLPGDWWGDYIYETRKDKIQTMNRAGEMVENKDSYNKTEFTSFTGYLLRKYFHHNYVSTSNQCENPFMLCRYAEVLLTYAEAKIELNQIDSDCLAALNAVRGRSDVMMPVVEPGLSQAEMRKIVRKERKVELFNENLRIDDLKRWRRAEVVLKRPIMGRPVLGDFEGYPDVAFDEFGDPVYDVASYEPHPSTDYRVVLNTNFQPRDYLWPIPEIELSLNPSLGQNDGW